MHESKILILFLSWFAFGDLLFKRLKSRQEDASNLSIRRIVPQVPGGLIFRKYHWWVQQIKMACERWKEKDIWRGMEQCGKSGVDSGVCVFYDALGDDVLF